MFCLLVFSGKDHECPYPEYLSESDPTLHNSPEQSKHK